MSELERKLQAKRQVQESQSISMGFARLASRVASVVGSPWAFLAATAAVVAWALTGPLYHYSNTWQLVINTATTIVTFLIVFLIQNTQNPDAKAIHLKLDELIRSIRKAHNEMIDIEKLGRRTGRVGEAIRAHPRGVRRTPPARETSGMSM